MAGAAPKVAAFAQHHDRPHPAYGIPQVGDRMVAFGPGPVWVMAWASWSPPSLVERDILRQVASKPVGIHPVRLVLLEVDATGSADGLVALGGAPIVPLAVLVGCDGKVQQCFLGWAGKNPAMMRQALEREQAGSCH